MASGFRCRDETRAHPHTLRAEGERRRQAATVGETAARQNRNIYRIDDRRYQDRSADSADMSASVDAGRDNRIDSVGDGLFRVAHGAAHRHNIYSPLVSGGDGVFRTAESGDQDRNPLLQHEIDHLLDRFRIACRDIALRPHGREQDIDPERFIGDRAHGIDLVFQLLAGHVGSGADDPEAAGSRYRAGQGAPRDESHSGLKDGVFDSEAVADFGLESRHVALRRLRVFLRIYRRSRSRQGLLEAGTLWPISVSQEMCR